MATDRLFLEVMREGEEPVPRQIIPLVEAGGADRTGFPGIS